MHDIDFSLAYNLQVKALQGCLSILPSGHIRVPLFYRIHNLAPYLMHALFPSSIFSGSDSDLLHLKSNIQNEPEGPSSPVRYMAVKQPAYSISEGLFGPRRLGQAA